ncbi:uncharacterized protein LOC109822673 [Asparagus officinalis]|uniref:uncharacterized protein LOC109822673 n=1 Tax=Asparagus officinalis TaxID=4686 RepID=UPI00098E135E|nr:uncharacterized protein LOC109822673 [Asparagus officinalis]
MTLPPIVLTINVLQFNHLSPSHAKNRLCKFGSSYPNSWFSIHCIKETKQVEVGTVESFKSLRGESGNKNVDPVYSYKRRVPLGPDPIHNRKERKSLQILRKD